MRTVARFASRPTRVVEWLRQDVTFALQSLRRAPRLVFRGRFRFYAHDDEPKYNKGAVARPPVVVEGTFWLRRVPTTTCSLRWFESVAREGLMHLRGREGASVGTSSSSPKLR